jgi:hypothetical protein
MTWAHKEMMSQPHPRRSHDCVLIIPTAPQINFTHENWWDIGSNNYVTNIHVDHMTWALEIDESVTSMSIT